MHKTVCASLIHTCELNPNKPALKHYARGQWIERSWAEYFSMIECVALGLQAQGVKPGSRVAIWSNTRLEWAIADLASLGLGATTIPIYQNSAASDVEFILADSGAEILICEDQKMVSLFKSLKQKPSALRLVVAIEKTQETDSLYTSWSDLQQVSPAKLEQNKNYFRNSCLERQAGELATIIYTSGTTGRPKGVVITHEQLTSEISEALAAVGVSADDVTLSFLPYAHIMGRLEMLSHVWIGYFMGFARSIERMQGDMAVIRPTVMLAVPRLFEKIFQGIQNQVEASPTRARLFHWALALSERISEARSQSKQPGFTDLALLQIARPLVFNPIHEKLGGRLKLAFSGGAPLAPKVAQFFNAVGVLLLEAYGLTETTGAVVANTPFEYRFGSVGKPLPDVQIRCAEDGEILVKSRKVMREYYNDRESTAESLRDGWFATGDIGEITSDGFLKITDRKKELIKTAGGKYVAPMKLEHLLKQSPYISQVFIFGDQQKFIVALITLVPQAVQKFAESQKLGTTDWPSLVAHPRVRELIRQEIANANAELASFETIKNFALLVTDFSLEEGEVTASLKIKRKVVTEKYRDTLLGLYNFEAAPHKG